MKARRLLVSVVAVGLLAFAGCGDDGDAVDETPILSGTVPADVRPDATRPSPSTAELVASANGLGIVSFGDDAETVVTTLTELLGPPDDDTGWVDPRDPANEQVWPGCPGTTARLLQWTGSLGILLTNWDGDLSQPAGTVETAYFAGYGLWPDTPLRTPEGAGPGVTLGELRSLYGDRLAVADAPDDAVGLYWFAFDGPGGPLHRTGGLRGWVVPPGYGQEDAPPEVSTTPDDSWTATAFTAGVSCATP